MMRAGEGTSATDSEDVNINAITTNVVSEVEKDLSESPEDVVSLVFLLYEVADTALSRLLVQQSCRRARAAHLHLLGDWVLSANIKPTWRQQFIEALLICQLYGIVKKLGVDVQQAKQTYKPDDLHFSKHVDLTKKILYKLCEKIDTLNLSVLKRSLYTYDIDTIDYSSCEMVFLKLMSIKIIKVADSDSNNGLVFSFEKLIKLLYKLPGLEIFSRELKMLENKDMALHVQGGETAISSSFHPISDFCAQSGDQKVYPQTDFGSIFNKLNELNTEEIQFTPDSKNLAKDCYPIKDPKKIGPCLIINQEEFHLCDQSIEDRNISTLLPKRQGSTFDTIALEKTMSFLNFHVVTKKNLNKTQILHFIQESIENHVGKSTSVFMLCILSHGVRDHIFAADCVKIKVEAIQKFLDSFECLRGLPKVLIIQACQSDDTPKMTIVADSPHSHKMFIGKSDFLIYWATSPEYEAYRAEEMGSIFIQYLCENLQKEGKREHLQDIFTKNNDDVNYCCNQIKIPQMPLMHSSLRKKLYLHRPK